MKIRFLGATGTVTGSRYVVQHDGAKLLIDCGLFQGLKALRQKNWEAFSFDPSALDAVVLTHAHLDHSGYLPRLMREGFRGPIYCTPATRDLAAILLPDSAKLQEADAERANRHGYSKHKPAEPLYTSEEAEAVLKQFQPQPVHTPFTVGRLQIAFSPVGHILGAASIRIAGDGKTLTFSGDVGRSNDPLMQPPEPLSATDFLVLESTYGDRRHVADDA
ncbi:MAG TPA: MBL fold metallo-hydrolase, partial [Permianibacter sp.]|nr:MBL fold metallo-hydrolase [Permianibacter sp.]